jgi:hypothetical protein
MLLYGRDHFQSFEIIISHSRWVLSWVSSIDPNLPSFASSTYKMTSPILHQKTCHSLQKKKELYNFKQVAQFLTSTERQKAW